MGAMHTDMNTDNRTRTVKEYAEQTGQNPDSVRVRASRKLGRPVGQLSALTADEWAQVYGTKPVQKPYTPTKQEKSVLTQNPVAANVLPPGNTKAEPVTLPALSTVRRFALDCILIGIVVGHAGLIWYDCAELWDVPGQIGGGLAFFIIVAAVMLATDPTKNITSQWALFLALCVDGAAWWVHRPVFESYRVSGVITDVLCGFLCSLSFGALFVYRHQKNN